MLFTLFEKRIEKEKVWLIFDIGEAPAIDFEESRLQLAVSRTMANALDSLLGRTVCTITKKTGFSTTKGVGAARINSDQAKERGPDSGNQ